MPSGAAGRCYGVLPVVASSNSSSELTCWSFTATRLDAQPGNLGTRMTEQQLSECPVSDAAPGNRRRSQTSHGDRCETLEVTWVDAEDASQHLRHGDRCTITR